ncbi:hypothetical protein [Methylovorus sp. MM2]|uniref:hypothetical protein n=1 Tax=Methylovorus sp. MM2 TaxID=1848038 RepID=UPI0010425E71|nr:hypothetical protein [Methylovorus sp. MM2]
MTLNHLMEALLSLVPSASLSVWPEEPPFEASEDTSVTRHDRFGFIVCWANTNTSPCPSEEELSAVTIP